MRAVSYRVALREAPLFWMAFAGALLVFALTRWTPLNLGEAPRSPQAVLDAGYAHSLRQDFTRYEVLPDRPQTFGAHVLPQFLLAGVSLVTGDLDRAGIWLSLVGIVATLGGMYPLCRSIFPLRGYAGVVMIGFAGAGAVQFGLSPDPAPALGMGLLTWGVAFFFTALDRGVPHRVFVSGMLIGMAGYVRIELGLVWVLLAMYLIGLNAYEGSAKVKQMPLTGMALGGLLMTALVLWPMIDRNLSLANVPVLPGFDAERILGGTMVPGGRRGGVGLVSRFFAGLRMLAVDRMALGIFAGLLWPFGVGISTVMNRHKAVPIFWGPFLIAWVGVLTFLSPVTGPASFFECLRITAPLLFPFAVLPPMYVVYHWLQAQRRSRRQTTQLWLMLGVGAPFFALVPLAVLGGVDRMGEDMEPVLEVFEAEPALAAKRVLTDRPGAFLLAGKRGVYGLNGETDWRIIDAKHADGSLKMEELNAYLYENEIGLLHVAQFDSMLPAELELVEGGPELHPEEAPSPHRLFRLVWE